MNVLFIGDIFGEPGIKMVENNLPRLIKEHNISFVIAQSENVTDRKGFIKRDYDRLKTAGINAFVLGNHVWAKNGIYDIINNHDIIRPLNIDLNYEGVGSRVFDIDGAKLRVTELMGIAFNSLRRPWKEETSNNFFDAIDSIPADEHDFHIIDFHGETTSEKNIFGIYMDGKANAVVGTHTHVQTADERTLPNGTAYITDVGMVGPHNAAIGADYNSVYQKMRFDKRSIFKISQNKCEFSGVLITLKKGDNKIKRIQFQED